MPTLKSFSRPMGCVQQGTRRGLVTRSHPVSRRGLVTRSHPVSCPPNVNWLSTSSGALVCSTVMYSAVQCSVLQLNTAPEEMNKRSTNYTAQHFIPPNCINVLHYITLHCTALHCKAVLQFAGQNSTALHCSAELQFAGQHSTVVLHCNSLDSSDRCRSEIGLNWRVQSWPSPANP